MCPPPVSASASATCVSPKGSSGSPIGTASHIHDVSNVPALPATRADMTQTLKDIVDERIRESKSAPTPKKASEAAFRPAASETRDSVYRHGPQPALLRPAERRLAASLVVPLCFIQQNTKQEQQVPQVSSSHCHVPVSPLSSPSEPGASILRTLCACRSHLTGRTAYNRSLDQLRLS